MRASNVYGNALPFEICDLFHRSVPRYSIFGLPLGVRKFFATPSSKEPILVLEYSMDDDYSVETHPFTLGFSESVNIEATFVLVAKGLPRVSWHSFRRANATLLGELGESIKTAQAILGHTDLVTTLNTYMHAIPDSQRRAVERVAGVLFPDVPKLTDGLEEPKMVN